MKDILDRIRLSLTDESSHDLYCRLVDAGAEIERLRADAARYRWLRDDADPNAIPDMIFTDPNKTDAHIDAEIAAFLECKP